MMVMNRKLGDDDGLEQNFEIKQSSLFNMFKQCKIQIITQNIPKKLHLKKISKGKFFWITNLLLKLVIGLKKPIFLLYF